MTDHYVYSSPPFLSILMRHYIFTSDLYMCCIQFDYNTKNRKQWYHIMTHSTEKILRMKRYNVHMSVTITQSLYLFPLVEMIGKKSEVVFR